MGDEANHKMSPCLGCTMSRLIRTSFAGTAQAALGPSRPAEHDLSAPRAFSLYCTQFTRVSVKSIFFQAHQGVITKGRQND